MSRNPEGRGSIPRLGSRRSSLISIEHAELLRSTPSLVLCCAWLVTMALHVHCHCGLGQLSPLPTSGDDKWVAAKHCGRPKRSRISDTHRLRSSLQFRYINNQSLLFTHTQKFSRSALWPNIVCLWVRRSRGVFVFNFFKIALLISRLDYIDRNAWFRRWCLISF